MVPVYRDKSLLELLEANGTWFWFYIQRSLERWVTTSGNDPRLQCRSCCVQSVTVAGVQTIAQKPNEAKCTGYSSTGGSNWRYRERSLYICRLFWLVSRYSSIQNSLCSYFSSHSTATKFRKFECSDYTFSAINSHGCCQITLFEIALFIVAIVQSSLFSTDWEKTEVF